MGAMVGADHFYMETSVGGLGSAVCLAHPYEPGGRAQQEVGTYSHHSSCPSLCDPEDKHFYFLGLWFLICKLRIKEDGTPTF